MKASTPLICAEIQWKEGWRRTSIARQRCRRRSLRPTPMSVSGGASPASAIGGSLQIAIVFDDQLDHRRHAALFFAHFVSARPKQRHGIGREAALDRDGVGQPLMV